MKKKRIWIALLAVVCLAMTSCYKRCACSGYNGFVYYFTPDEVDAMGGGSCDNMRYQANTQYYSYCEWE